jgi:hypothetical protein
MRSRIIQTLDGPHGALWVAALSLVLSLPSIALPPVLDDHGIRTRLVIDGGGPDDVFHLIARGDLRQHGRAAWWSSPAPELHFFRPLAGLTHFVDFRLWPNAALLMRLQNCLWYALLVWLSARAYRRLTRRRGDDDAGDARDGAGAAAWILAALMFAVDEAHGQSLSFIAGRNTFLWALLGIATLLSHHAHRVAPSRARAIAAPLAFAGALLSGEGGLGTLGYLVAYALCLDGRPRAARLRSLASYAGVLVGWAALYVAGGYGTHGRALYRSPLHDPLGVLIGGLSELPIWLASQLSFGFATAALPAEPTTVRLAALPVALLLAWCLWPVLRAQRIARFYGLGFVLALVPLFASWPQDRLLILASFGAFGLLGCFLSHATTALSRGRRFARGVLVALHLVIAPFGFVGGYLVAWGIVAAEARVDAALPSGDDAANTGVVIVRAPTVLTLKYARERREAHGSALPPYTYELYSAGGALQVRRPSASSLELEPAAGYCASRVDCGSYDLKARFGRGRRFTLAAMQVEIVDVDARGAPRRVRFDFPTPLEDPSRRLLYWTDRGIEPFPLPAVGERVEVPRMSLLSAFR